MVGFLSYASEYLKLSLLTRIRFFLIAPAQFNPLQSQTLMRLNPPAFSLPPREATGH
jgi:hypothetical protein